MTIGGLLGRKIGMTTYYYDDGTAEPVTAVEVGPCTVTQVKTRARDGYEAVQIGFLPARKLNQAESGHQSRSGGKFSHLQEFIVDDLAEFEVGQELKADVFEVGESIKVVGVSKGAASLGLYAVGISGVDPRLMVNLIVIAHLVLSARGPHRVECGPAQKWADTTVLTVKPLEA